MVKRTNIALVSLAALALAACGMDPQEKFARAQGNFTAHEYSQARLDLVSALEGQPEDVAMLKMLAQVQLKLGDAEGALFALEQLEKAGGKLDDPILFRAEAEILRGRNDDALELLQGDKRADAHRLRALALVREGKFDEAREELKRGMDGTGPKAELQADYAQFLMADGNLDEGAKIAAMALAAAPDALGPQIASAVAAERLGQREKALQFYEKASKSYPESSTAMIGRIRQLGELDRVDEAEGLIKAAVARSPDDVEVVFLAARLDAEKGDWSEARTRLQRVESRMREYPDAQLLYARSLLEEEQVELARSILRRLNARFPEHAQSAALLAEVLLSQGDPAAAQKVLAPVVAQEGVPEAIRQLYRRAETQSAGRS